MAAADFQIEDGDGRVTLRLIGDWTATSLGRISRRLDDSLHQRCVDAVVPELDHHAGDDPRSLRERRPAPGRGRRGSG